MASLVPHRAPSTGAIIKKLLAINPDLGTNELIAIIRQCTRIQGGANNEFGNAEVIDEEKALQLARESIASAQKLRR